jgi:ubiquinone biosynthesis accessory factor UbiK
MSNRNILEELSEKLSAILPMAEEIRGEVRTKIERQLKKSFESMDILSREEFDAQANSLQRAEQRIEELEASLSRLAKRLDEIEGPSG